MADEIVESGAFGPPQTEGESRRKEYLYSERVGGSRVRHSDFLDFIRSPRAGRECHSDGFLALGGLVEPAYECECGFRGLFVDVKCARCGRIL